MVSGNISNYKTLDGVRKHFKLQDIGWCQETFKITSYCMVSGNTSNYKTLMVSGNTSNYKTVMVSGNTSNYKTLMVSGNTSNYKTLMVSGNTSNYKTLDGVRKHFKLQDIGWCQETLQTTRH
ncbi:hypothetical protein BgiBS90_018084 [Biomphalaria glabrata]|nr:hypothetical protein BgiBS90_018084 [Biomphalaria glabrata]